MNLGALTRDEGGLRRASVWPGHSDVLLAALDPEAAFVLIETWDGNSDWHEAQVSVAVGDEPRTRLVRHHSFDLLVTPEEAIEVGLSLRAQGKTSGGLECHQFRQRPRPEFHLPGNPRARADAMRGHDVLLSIELPHDAEVAVVSSPSRPDLEGYISRLASTSPG